MCISPASAGQQNASINTAIPNVFRIGLSLYEVFERSNRPSREGAAVFFVLADRSASMKKGLPHMTLADEHLKELDNPSLTTDERALIRCRVAADLIHAGQYEQAGETLGELWRGTGERPNVEGLGERATAEVLLQAGVLSGLIGKGKGAQEVAKDLISESAALFEGLGKPNRAADARADLAVCYWREGAYQEARAVLESAAALIEENTELKAKTVLCFAVVESSAGRYGDVLRLLTESAPLFAEGVSHRLRGIFHNELALALRRLGTAERRQDYHDRAIIEYTAAAYHFEQAGREQYAASIENNLAFLLYKLGRYPDAHKHLDRAQAVLTRLKDASTLAQVDETRTRVLIAELRYRDADRTLAGVLKTLEKGDESALLADALTLQGVIWARLWEYQRSINVLRRAAEVAETAGALLNAGQAMLTLLEEHGLSRLLPPAEVYDAYQRADVLLKDAQDAEVAARLRACARLVMRRLAETPIHEKNFSLYGAMHEYEARLIEQALEDAGGSVTKAARILGLTHQTLSSKLAGQHRQLLGKRTPPKKRLKSIIKDPSKK
jgi:tetratricopeptide (TPR) repeat protein